MLLFILGKQWWREVNGGSTPWQCLAACIEIRNALQLLSPEEYISYLPISQVFFLNINYFCFSFILFINLFLLYKFIIIRMVHVMVYNIILH